MSTESGLWTGQPTSMTQSASAPFGHERVCVLLAGVDSLILMISLIFRKHLESMLVHQHPGWRAMQSRKKLCQICVKSAMVKCSSLNTRYKPLKSPASMTPMALTFPLCMDKMYHKKSRRALSISEGISIQTRFGDCQRFRS